MAPKNIYIVFFRYPPGMLAITGKADYLHYRTFSTLKKAKTECEEHLSYVKKDAKMEWQDGDKECHGMDPMGYPIYTIVKDIVR